MNKKLKKILVLDKKLSKAPKLSSTEKDVFESEQRFEATYYQGFYLRKR